MTDHLTPDRVKPFLDDLARISFRHGVCIEDWEGDGGSGVVLKPLRPEVVGYSALPDGYGIWLSHHVGGLCDPEEMLSLDLTKLSNHEKMEILGARSPDLARMLREAFEEGISVTGEGYNGEMAQQDEVRAKSLRLEADAFERRAAKIMGGEG